MFSPKQRRIFRYHNGEKQVAGDPLAIQRRLLTFPDFDLIGATKLLSIKNPGGKLDPNGPVGEAEAKFAAEAMREFEKMVAASRHAFKIKPLDEDDETGLTDAETVQVLVDFGVFMDDLRKNTGGPQTWPNSTAPQSSAGETGRPTTGPTSASTSTGTEPSPAVASA